MKRYEKYKDSGIEWIGEIPNEWLQSKLKFEVDLVLGKMLEDKEPFNNEGDYTLEPYLKSRNIGMLEVYNDIKQVDKMWFNSKEKIQYELQEGDLVMNEGGEIGKVSLWKNPGFRCFIQNSVHKITPHFDVLNSTYLQYLIFHVTTKGYFNTIVSSISIAHLTKEKLADTPILLPPLSEQQAIASYLDHKVGQIDATVSAINTQIEDLKAYRQSVISEAVTKGLNHNVEMKDSGIEWIGKIPEGWEIVPIKSIFLERKELSTEGNEELLSISEYFGVKPRKEVIKEGEFLSHAESFVGYKKCCKGDIVSNIMLAWKGCLGIAPCDGIISPAYCVYIPSPAIESKYYNYLFRSKACTNEFKKKSRGLIDSRLRLYSPDFFMIKVTLPSKKEQQAIATYLDEKTSKIDASIKSLEAQREDLKVLKQSIISEAVTGKIDVRNWKQNN